MALLQRVPFPGRAMRWGRWTLAESKRKQSKLLYPHDAAQDAGAQSRVEQVHGRSAGKMPRPELVPSVDLDATGTTSHPEGEQKVVELHEDGAATGIEIERHDDSRDAALIENPYNPEYVNVRQENKTVYLLCARIDHDEIDLSPEFQRRPGIWDLTRQCRLIESILLRIPLPVFYVAADAEDHWSVVDGLQRMTTIHNFLKDKFKLRSLEYLVRFDGFGFSDLPRGMQRRILETELIMNVIQSGTPEEVTFNIFSRINTGGVTLNEQEIRHALNKGPVRDFLLELVSMEEFKTATLGSINDKRMLARECALRFVAFYLTNWKDYKYNDLGGFLSSTMKKINHMNPEERAKLKSVFGKAMKISAKIFHNDAFRKRYSMGASRNPISKVLFESWAVSLSRLEDEEVARLVARKKRLRARFINLCKDRDFDASISYSTGIPARVHKRFAAVERLVRGVLDDE